MNETGKIILSFDDEEPMKEAVRKLLESGEKIIDVQTPFPVHGLDKLLSFKRTRIPVGGFFFGMLGAISAFGFMTWVFTVSYPLIVGGKPHFAAPSFIPITFEVTVLFAGLSMVIAFLVRSRLKPDIDFKPVSEGVTDDRFVIIIDDRGGAASVEELRRKLDGITITDIN